MNKNIYIYWFKRKAKIFLQNIYIEIFKNCSTAIRKVREPALF